ncbi:MAG: hypothetical protein C0460_08890 [Methylibium sp.]|jgi:hypothetical protein|nr:hypothetical protein [Methylibium sp.]|mmetsp:Transcript_10462/g.42714  ORF Transcript_10462/g.42714 Transcript_10462/m.42714 type:complete len:282 (+) Transcript_10462:457-1302(+)
MKDLNAAGLLGIDVSDMRLGDRMASVWWAQRRRLDEGQRFVAIDENRMLREGFSLPRFFPQTFVDLPPEQAARLPRWDQGKLWLTVTNVFAQTPLAGHFEHLPESVLQRAETLRAGRNAPRVLIHQLNDAHYNRARNWHQDDADALTVELRALGLEPRLLNPVPGQFLGGYDEMLAQMLAADLFIGGDTGPSHLFAMLCPDKPQLAIYPDMGREERLYAALQRELGLPLAWDSRPKRPDLLLLTMRRSHRWVRHRWYVRPFHVGRFDAREAAGLALQALNG